MIFKKYFQPAKNSTFSNYCNRSAVIGELATQLTMQRFIIVLLMVIDSVLMFHQTDYTFSFERTVLDHYNKNYLKDFKVVTYKYNRTQPAVNGSFTCLMDFGYNLRAVFQAYTFLSNEYRTFPLRYSFDFCDAIAKNDYGFQDTLRYGNFTGCPLNKGSDYVYNWKPNGSRFPPHLPNGQYMLEIQLMHFSEELVLLQGYATISRPLGRRH